MSLQIIDLFAGVGGLSLGFEMAGFKVVLANEYDPSIADAYVRNRKNTNMIVADITSLDIDTTFSEFKGKIDVIIGGPPCQGFSQKGQRKSVLDERNYLFKYYYEVVKCVQPRYFVMENVPNLLTTEHGFFKEEIYNLFKAIGYSLNSDILNASDYGVPQNRCRTCIIGYLGNHVVQMPKKHTQKVTVWDAISDLAFLESGEGTEEQDYPIDPQTEYQAFLRGKETVLHNHIITKHSKIALERLSMIPPEGGKDYLPAEHLTKSIYSGTWTRMSKNEQSVTITTRFDTPSSGKFTHPYLNRAISVREAARIQSFPDSFVFYGNKSSQMKQVGNAVPPLLAYEMARAILNDMESSPMKKETLASQISLWDMFPEQRPSKA